MSRFLKYSITCCFAIVVFLSAYPSFAQLIAYQGVQLASPLVADTAQSVRVVAGDGILNGDKIIPILVVEFHANTPHIVSIDPSGNVFLDVHELPHTEAVFVVDTADGISNMSLLATASATLSNTVDPDLSIRTDPSLSNAVNFSDTADLSISSTADLDFSNTYNVLYGNNLSYPVPVTRNATFVSTELTSHTDILPFCKLAARCHLSRINPKEDGPMERTSAGGLSLGAALSGGFKWQKQTAHLRSTIRCRWKMLQNI